MFNSKDQKTSDRQLLSKIKEGSTAAFDTLYEKYWETIYSTAFKRLQNTDQAKDVNQPGRIFAILAQT